MEFVKKNTVMTKIFSVEKIEIALNKSNPPSLVVNAYGKTKTAGWTDIRLQPLWNRTHPPKDGIYEFVFVGTPPSGPAQDVITEVGPTSYTFSFGDTIDARNIVVYAASNSKTEKRHVDIDPGFSPHGTTNFPRTATGYSNNWDLEEAINDAIANLPPDEHPFPDKLYHFTVESIGAEIGGIAGLHRLRISISG